MSPKAAHAVHAALRACIDDVTRAIDDDDNHVARNNALEQLKAKLSDLWKMRAEREEAFAETINMLQAVLVQRRVEDFCKDHLVCIRSIFEKMQQEPIFYDAFVNTITVELLEGGIDVFREIE